MVTLNMKEVIWLSSIGDRIKNLRIMYGLSQEEVGNRVGVQRAAINKYEKGLVTNIPLTTVEKLATLFDVSPTYIVGWTEDVSGQSLSSEVKIINGVSKAFGKDAVELLEGFVELNTKGRKRVLQYIDDLSESEMFRD